MAFEEEDLLQLSGLQHFAFCRRQWALIHIENQWAENLRTVEGDLFYGETRRRLNVAFDPELRQKVVSLTGEIHQLFRRGHTPKVKPTNTCGWTGRPCPKPLKR